MRLAHERDDRFGPTIGCWPIRPCRQRCQKRLKTAGGDEASRPDLPSVQSSSVYEPINLRMARREDDFGFLNRIQRPWNTGRSGKCDDRSEHDIGPTSWGCAGPLAIA